MNIECFANKMLEIKNHNQYAEILRRLQSETAIIQLLQIDGIDHTNDAVLENAKRTMPLLKTEAVNRFMSGRYSGKNTLYTFQASEAFFNCLLLYEAFFIDFDNGREHTVRITGFGYDDIAFINSNNRVLFYTITHEGLAFYDDALLDLASDVADSSDFVASFKIKGTYSSAIVYTANVEATAAAQLETLCSQPFAKGSKIRVMPDVHAGKGCVIGFTADLGEMVIPNIVGVDIGCGMLTVKLGKVDIDFETLDSIINDCVPAGMEVHTGRIRRFPKLQTMHCYRELKDAKRLERSIGTLGGGNHFIEIDIDDEGEKHLVIHTGSRNLGKQVAELYQNLAYDVCRGLGEMFELQKQLIADYKAQGRKSEIQAAIKQLKSEYQNKTTDIPKELCYLTDEYRQRYLDDMGVCQEFAVLNRRTIAEIILDKLFGMPLDAFEHFETVHNYIDLKNNIVRKGAVSANRGEVLLVPINMRDGSLICVGKGNEDWNCSAPHGAGRLMSRGTAHETLSLEEYKQQMQGIYSTCICESTLDESPMAYKSMDEIVRQITPTAKIIKQIKPIYNFKAI